MLLEDLQDVMVVEHCQDVITWLEQHRSLLASPAYKTGQQQVGARGGCVCSYMCVCVHVLCISASACA